MRYFFVIMMILFTTACTGRLVLMQNDKGDVQKCEVTANEEIMTGAFMSGRQVDRCVEQWEALGYKKATK